MQNRCSDKCEKALFHYGRTKCCTVALRAAPQTDRQNYLEIHHRAHDLCFGKQCRDGRLVANATAAVGLVAAECKREAASSLSGKLAACSVHCTRALDQYQHSPCVVSVVHRFSHMSLEQKQIFLELHSWAFHMCIAVSGKRGGPLAPNAKKLVPLQERLGKKIEDLKCSDVGEQDRLQEVLSQITTHCFKYVDKAAVAKSLSSMRSGQKQHAPLHSCNNPCKKALVQYNVSRCIDPALRRFRATDSHSKREAFRSTVDVAFKSCFGDACLNIHAQHAALKVVQELVGRCRVEIRNWLAGKPTAQCSTACKTVLSMYQADPCIANGLQELDVSDFEKQYFWEMYAHAYDACLSTDEDAPPKSFCEKDDDSESVAETQINDMMRQCGKSDAVNICSKECRQAYSRFRTAKCSNVVLVQMSFALQVSDCMLTLTDQCSDADECTLCRLRSGMCTTARGSPAHTTAH